MFFSVRISLLEIGDIMIRKHVEGFNEFLRENGVIGLAIGFVLAGAVGKVVTSLVSNIINPVVGLILGQAKGLDKISFHIASANILIGSFISTLIDFSIVALVVYLGYKWLRLEKLHKKKEEQELKEENLKKIKKSV